MSLVSVILLYILDYLLLFINVYNMCIEVEFNLNYIAFYNCIVFYTLYVYEGLYNNTRRQLLSIYLSIPYFISMIYPLSA